MPMAASSRFLAISSEALTYVIQRVQVLLILSRDYGRIGE